MSSILVDRCSFGPLNRMENHASNFGTIFKYKGEIPAEAYQPKEMCSVERAVFENDFDRLVELINNGTRIDINLKIGQMSGVEFSAMRGYTDILRLLIESSVNVEILKDYFKLNVIDRAYFLSNNKEAFLTQNGLAEVNRYEAALYTAVFYNQPSCVKYLLGVVGDHPLKRKSFKLNNLLSSLDLNELSTKLGHEICSDLLESHYGIGSRSK